MNSSRTGTNAKGFTIVEILVATSIFAVIMIAALLMYDRSNRVFKSGVEAADVQQNTRIAFDKIVADLRMAGFDFDRDGTPSLENAYQQPDEQIEYVSDAAITVRANYDYNDDPVNTDHGREFVVGGTPGASGLESANFPVVTTGNDEIVTYALVSADSTANTGTISFYADVPDRKSHPETGGRKENQVTITGVDLTNNNPPYTLERISLNPSTASITPLIRYPIATNIRSMTFEYYEDQVGTAPLTDLAGNVIAIADYGSTVGGLGQYDPAATSVEVERQLRQKIQSIKVVLTGMTENPDPNYNDPNDTIAPRHRKYRLESLIVPRNYGRRGFKEQDYVEPSAPTITKVCVGYCGVAYVEWDQPVTGGSPEDYQIRVDTDPAGSYPIREAVGLKTFDFVKLPDATQSYFFIVAAINSYGSAASPRYPAGATGLSAKNDTKPDVVADADVALTPISNAIRIDWKAPETLDPTSNLPSCSPSGPEPPDLPIEEFEGGGFVIKRSRTTGFDPATQGEVVFDPQAPLSPQTPNVDPITYTADYIDRTTVNKMGPAACYPYYYRIRTQEACFTAPTNVGNDPTKAQSTNWSAEQTTTLISGVQPQAPATLEVDESVSVCDAPPATDGYCYVKLKWEKVKKDISFGTTNEYITIGQYLVYRDTYDMDGTLRESNIINARFEEWDAWLASSTPPEVDFSDPAFVTFVDETAPSRELPGMPPAPGLGNDPVYNEYRVVAKQCLGEPSESPDSDASPTVKFPCTFTPVLVSASMSGTIEGDGSSGNPWLIQPTSELSLVFDTTVASMEASVLLPDTSRAPLAASSFDGLTGIFPWDSGLPDGVAYRIDVIVTTTDGCKRTFSYYIESTATNCCLTPVDIETRLLQQDGPGQRTRVRLQNRCSADLTLQSVRVVWDPTKFLSQVGAERLTEIVYPAAADPLGTCPRIIDTVPNPANTTSPLTRTPPIGSRVIVPPDSSGDGVICHPSGDPANGSDDYEIEIRFNKAYDPLAPVVGQVCITYIRTGDLAATQCQILPGASAAQGVCDTP